MAKPIKRDEFEGLEEVGYSALATPVKIGLAIAAVGVGIGVLAGLGAAGEAYTLAAAAGNSGIAAYAGSLVTSALQFGLVAGVGAAALGAVAWPVTAGLALFGAMKGTKRVEKENAAYAAKMKEHGAGHQAEIAAVHNQAMQQGFQAGAEQGRQIGQQEGAQMVMAQLQQHAAQENAGKSFAATETQRREQAAAAAAAGAQIG